MPGGIYANCTSVTPSCPVSATTYGYAPNLGGNVFLCAVFGLCTLVQLALGIRYRTWTWMIGLSLGCAMETAGYVGRILMHFNAWNQGAFEDQIITLVLAPSFMAAGIDLVLKHVVHAFGAAHLSLIPPAAYPWTFISIDIAAILMQGAGGGVAAGASSSGDATKIDTGNDIIVAGLIVQVAQLAIFGVLSAVLAWRIYANRATLVVDEKAPVIARGQRFWFFVGAVVLAYVCILIRCIYR